MKEYIDIFFNYLKISVFTIIGIIVVVCLIVLGTVPMQLTESTGHWQWMLCYIPVLFAIIGGFAWIEYSDRHKNDKKSR